MILSEHARQQMLQSGIDESDVRACLEHGELVIKQVVKGEMRYGKQIELKNKNIIVIYTRRENEARVVTVYTIKRKRWQQNS